MFFSAESTCLPFAASVMAALTWARREEEVFSFADVLVLRAFSSNYFFFVLSKVVNNQA